jgi:hypothetical protein
LGFIKTDISIIMNKRPVVIIASTRSGSSAFAWYFGRIHGLKIWTEPNNSVGEFEAFKRWLATEKTDYVLKIIAHQLVNNEVYKTILEDDCYKIKLTRSNKIEQIASHYIAHSTWIWNSPDQYARGVAYTVDIDAALVNSTIKDIINNDRIFDNLDIKFDETHTYEELINTVNLDSTGMVKIMPPTNYNEIRAVIKEEYEKYR